MAGSPLSRRRVLQGGAAAAAGIAGSSLWHGPADAESTGLAADLVLYNGQIVTMGPGFRVASAIAITSGRIV